MSATGLTASAMETKGTSAFGEGIKRSINTLSTKKPSKFRAIIMIATAAMMFASGLKMLKKRKANMSHGLLP